MTSLLKILAIADDATGALEVGGQLAVLGVHTLVTTQSAVHCNAGALVVDAETRHLTPEQAAGSVRRLATEAQREGLRFIYKKTDSTLRGNIASEFQALLDSFPDRILVYVPAYPKMKRTVAGGELFVDGTPLSQTAFARDALNPSREGNIPALLAGDCRAPVAVAGTSEDLGRLLCTCPPGTVVVCDGASDADLRQTAEVIAESKRDCIAAGTGGFVGDLARHLPVTRTTVARKPQIERCLVVAGSLHPASREQVRRASGLIRTLYLDKLPDAEAVRAIASLDWAAVATSGNSPADVGPRLGAMVRDALAARPVNGLVIFGGDTALAVLDSLGLSTVRSVGELLPGIPLSSAAYKGRELVLITKAGGFGGPETLLEIKEHLERET